MLAPRSGVMVIKLVSIDELRLNRKFDPHIVVQNVRLCATYKIRLEIHHGFVQLYITYQVQFWDF